MSRSTLPLLMALAGIWLAGCSSLFRAPTPLPTFTPTVTLTPTATIQWFPPTTTPLPPVVPTLQPTPNLRPGIGRLVYSDRFQDASLWHTGRDEGGTITVVDGGLTLAVSRPKMLLASLNNRQIVSDAYMEITAEPSLCRGDDLYGFLVRASSPTDGYRLLISCNGRVRLERIRNYTLVVLQDWTPSGQARPGALQPIRLGVWANGREIRVFINDVYQFSAIDPVWQSGQVGVLARTAGSTPLTVTFSDLEVYELGADAAAGDPLPTLAPTRRMTSTPS